MRWLRGFWTAIAMFAMFVAGPGLTGCEVDVDDDADGYEVEVDRNGRDYEIEVDD